MGKKTNGDDEEAASWRRESAELSANSRRKGLLPLGIGDILALLALLVLSAALLLEAYHKEFKDYSKEIVALFAIVVGFLLGRKT